MIKIVKDMRGQLESSLDDVAAALQLLVGVHDEIVTNVSNECTYIAPDAIGEIWLTYQVMADCLEVVLDDLRPGRIDSLQGTSFMDTPMILFGANIQISRETLNDHTILAMWAVFEREMIAVLESEAHKILGTSPSAFNKALLGKIEVGIERWRSDDMIDLFKPVFNRVYQTNQTLPRLAAHRNLKKLSPGLAYEAPVEALKQMHLSCRT